MLATLFSAIVGGVFVIVGGWLAINWQSDREARRVAGALLAELSVAKEMLEKDGVAVFYQQTLDHWKATGEVLNKQTIIDMFDNQPQEVLPVYYSMVGKLGLLPRALASDVVEYHARIIALPRVIVRFLGKQDLDKPTVKLLAHSVQGQFEKINVMRDSLVLRLSAFADSRDRILSLTGDAVG
jgi:hypothetical protein